MSDFRDVTFGEHLFSRIDDNVYLQKLYHNILINYSRRLFHLDEMEEQPVNIGDALTFADVLSKSCGTNLSDIHKTRAQEMVALLYDMYPKDEQVKYYLGSVLASTGNFLGMNRLTPDFENASLLERVFMHFNMDYLSVPSDGGARFFPAQKEIYDSLSRPYFSYSAPTSMGKSFMMRAFIKQQIVDGAKKNFALLIPTKALINEVTSELIESLTTLLKETDYRIVTSSGSMALETKHNYIFVLTPERMLYILIDDPDLKIDYLFVDEAHKISSGDKRSAFYYKVINKLEERHSNAHIIFASPNIPNPGIYLDTLSMGESTIGEGSIVACRYAPVSQLKYIVDLWERNIRVFDSYSKKFILLHEMSRQYSLSEVIARIGDKRHNIVYCKSKNDAIQFARDYADTQEPIGDKKLQTFAEAIRNDVHKEYYLAELVERGVAYHIGYLPANIRMQLEDYYREGLIKTMFCTSTLLEGVNLPAENLFITSYKKGRSDFSEVDFKNLVGRVGRAKYNLYGNVFIVRLQKQEREEDLQKFENLLKDDVPPQKLSIEAELNSNQKKLIVDTLLSGSVEIHKSKKNQSEDNYELMRKTMLILVGDVFRNKTVNYTDPHDGGIGISQNDPSVKSDWKIDLSTEDWFVYTDNYGTSEEKAFVAYFRGYVAQLRKMYNRIYLIRNEREFHIYSFEDGERFEPDYVLFLQRDKTDGFEQLQIFIEPKGTQLLEKDAWKEKFLLQLRTEAVPATIFVDDNDYKIWGLHFFNQDNRMKEFDSEFAALIGK